MAMFLSGLIFENNYFYFIYYCYFFFLDLICVFDRGVICDLILNHLDEFIFQISAKKVKNLAKESVLLTHMMLDFYKLISDHESFVPLNLPKRIDISKVIIYLLFLFLLLNIFV
jgi:hypothetical protein